MPPGTHNNPATGYSHNLAILPDPLVSCMESPFLPVTASFSVIRSALHSDNKLSILHIQHKGITCMHISGKDLLCSQCLHIILQITLQRSCTVYRIITILRSHFPLLPQSESGKVPGQKDVYQGLLPSGLLCYQCLLLSRA